GGEREGECRRAGWGYGGRVRGNMLLLSLRGDGVRDPGHLQGAYRNLPESMEEATAKEVDEEKRTPQSSSSSSALPVTYWQNAISCHVDFKEFEMIKVSIDGSAEVIELDREMWEQFHGAGFGRSPSQRQVQ
ncbi:hypothetical protein Ancab_011370, partial [Ancistrocladus abbreviatus]